MLALVILRMQNLASIAGGNHDSIDVFDFLAFANVVRLAGGNQVQRTTNR